MGDGKSSELTVSSVPSRGPLQVRIDYSMDVNNFFDTQQKRNLLQLAADNLFSKFSDSLTAITPSGANTWQAIVQQAPEPEVFAS